MILAVSSIVVRFSQILGFPFFADTQKTIYGLETYEQFSPLSLFITSLILFKGLTGYALWTEKKWAIQFGIIDALAGIAVCILVMFIAPIFTMGDGEYDFNRRYELLLLVPYAVHLFKMRKKWEKFSKVEPVIQFISQFEDENLTIEEKTPEVLIDDKPEVETIDKEDPTRFMPK